mgnify:CR=1 FL=1
MEITVALIQHRAYDVRHSAEGLEAVLSMLEDAPEADLVVLPECSYPGYYLGLLGDPFKAAEGWEKALEAFRDYAARRKCHVVAGIAERDGSKLYNSAFLIGRDGAVIGRSRKTFLWHFDSKWFSPGEEYSVFDTDLGKLGMIVCADGRLPEISRALALKGAEIIVDSTNWVTSGSDPARLANPQVEYMMAVRAAENGAFFLCANKVGTEAESVVYCGRSLIVAPTGDVVREASSDKEETVVATLTLDPRCRAAAMALRREHYSQDFSLLAKANEATPLRRVIETPMIPGTSCVQVAMAQVDRDISLQNFIATASSLASRLSQQGADLVAFPEVPCCTMREFTSPIKEAFGPLASRLRIHLAVASHGNPSVTLAFTPDGQVSTCDGRGDALLKVGELRVGFLRGRQALVPEAARVLFLKGADLLVWQADLGTGLERKVCMTRAAENRVFVALANCSSKGSSKNSMIVSPDGRTLAETFPGTTQAVMALVSPAQSRVKSLIRGSDVFRDRRPDLYGDLARP